MIETKTLQEIRGYTDELVEAVYHLRDGVPGASKDWWTISFILILQRIQQELGEAVAAQEKVHVRAQVQNLRNVLAELQRIFPDGEKDPFFLPGSALRRILATLEEIEELSDTDPLVEREPHNHFRMWADAICFVRDTGIALQKFRYLFVSDFNYNGDKRLHVVRPA